MSKSTKGASDLPEDLVVAPRFLSGFGAHGALYLDLMDGKGALRIDPTATPPLEFTTLGEAAQELWPRAFVPVPLAAPFGPPPPCIKGSGCSFTDSALDTLLAVVQPPAGASLQDVRAVMRSYLYLQGIRSILHVRVILLPYGPPGKGKTLLARGLGRILYGPGFQVTTLPKRPQDCYPILASCPLVVVDNVEDLPADVCDLLCSVATGIELMSRKLYTDYNVCRIRPDVFLVLTTFSAGGIRGDLLDRALPVRVVGLSTGIHGSERVILNTIDLMRPAVIWEMIRVLCNIMPLLNTPPQPTRDRLVDFRHFGGLIAEVACGPAERLSFERGYDALRAERFRVVAEGNPLLSAVLDELSNGPVADSATGWMGRVAKDLGATSVGAINQQSAMNLGLRFRELKKGTAGIVLWTQMPRIHKGPREWMGELL